MTNQKITNKISLVTGSTGQDGSYLIEYLLDLGHIVYAIHRRSASPNTDRLRDVLDHPNLHMVCADITDYSSIFSAIERARPDYIFNLAAMSHVGISFNEPLHSTDVTYTGVLNILESLRHLYTEEYQPRLYQAGSSEMFGDGISYSSADGRIDTFFKKMSARDKTMDIKEMFQDEQTPMNPQSPYAIAKLAATHACRLYRESYGIKVSVGILFNHTSPRRGDNFVEKKICNYVNDYNNFVSNLSGPADVVYAEDHLVVGGVKYPKLKLGNINASRDIGHARDYVKAMYMMLHHEPDDFVISTGETHSIKDILAGAFAYTNLDHQQAIMIDKNLLRPAEVPHLKGRSARASDELSWKPSYTFSDIIAEMINKDKRTDEKT